MNGVGIWQPKRFRKFERNFRTSTGVALIETDAGQCYIKALGNPEGPHALAAEWVGTRLASAFGLPTFDIALLTLEKSDEIPFPKGGFALPGPAFCARQESGYPWGGSKTELEQITNPHDITRLVVFDTWTLNIDRHSPDPTTRRPNRDNVFLSTEREPAGSPTLLAMDHTHCFTSGGELNNRLLRIDRIQADGLYGLFPEFVPFLSKEIMVSCTHKMVELSDTVVGEIVATLPREWDVDAAVKGALTQFLHDRARYLSGSLEASWNTAIGAVTPTG